MLTFRQRFQPRFAPFSIPDLAGLVDLVVSQSNVGRGSKLVALKLTSTVTRRFTPFLGRVDFVVAGLSVSTCNAK